jgi:hypothetical protein
MPLASQPITLGCRLDAPGLEDFSLAIWSWRPHSMRRLSSLSARVGRSEFGLVST